jgi:O-antigen ligase
MRENSQLDLAMIGESVCLLLAFPVLYFPHWFPAWGIWPALLLLIASWIWRRWRLGIWLMRTPVDWPMFFLFMIMLPIAVWAAPPDLREKYSLPRACILIWDFAAFWFVVTYGSRRIAQWRVLMLGFLGLGSAIALMAALGVQWPDKVPGFAGVLQRIPSPLASVFRGAESGFSANQVAGTLLFFLPVAIVLLGATFTRYKQNPLWWLGGVVTAAMVALLLATQSRSGMIGFVAGITVSTLLPSRWGRRLLTGLGLGVVLLLWLRSDFVLTVAGTMLSNDLSGQTGTLLWRIDVWEHALNVIQDFRFTGMGLGTFREAVDIYPPFMTGPRYDLAHAHNFFLQQALDFGVPGLVALLAIYLATTWQVAALWHYRAGSGDQAAPIVPWRIWALGFAASLAAQTVFSLTDTVAMGSKPNVLFWYLLALVLGTATLTVGHAVPERAAQ